MTDNFLNISALSKSYTDNNEKINVLSDLNLTLADNSIVISIGPFRFRKKYTVAPFGTPR